MQNINYIKDLPKKFTYGKVYLSANYIEYGKLKENLKELVDSLKIKMLDFRYKREDKNHLLGHFTDFNFWLESDNKILIILDCDTNRNTLYYFLDILKQFCDDNLIELKNWFEKDGYYTDTVKKEIIRKIYRKEN